MKLWNEREDFPGDPVMGCDGIEIHTRAQQRRSVGQKPRVIHLGGQVCGEPLR